jgi:hypothetical protein
MQKINTLVADVGRWTPGTGKNTRIKIQEIFYYYEKIEVKSWRRRLQNFGRQQKRVPISRNYTPLCCDHGLLPVLQSQHCPGLGHKPCSTMRVKRTFRRDDSRQAQSCISVPGSKMGSSATYRTRLGLSMVDFDRSTFACCFLSSHNHNKGMLAWLELRVAGTRVPGEEPC